jgi:fumarate hydratase, class II
VKASVASGRSIADVAVELGGLTPAEAKRLLDPEKLTGPGRG